MSSQPPFTQPPYDPRTQWRVYREQQRAAWRAQRDAWKAQRHMWKASYGGAYVPQVPSVVGPIILVGIGVVGLLLYSGKVEMSQLVAWYGHWWPLLLIVAGVALLGEWALDIRRTAPVRRSGGFVGPLIFLAILGLFATGWSNWWGPLRANWGNNGDNFFNMFGLPEHDQDQQALNTQVPANSVIQIENPRGDVSVTAGDGNQVEVEAHLVAYANSDEKARKIFDAEQAHVTVSGNTVLVKSDSNDSGRMNVAVTVPKTAQVSVKSGHGDVTIAGLGNGATVVAEHGDVHLSSIVGSVQVRFPGDKHDFSAHDIQGDLTASGNCNDLTLSQIKGRVTTDGEIFGDVHLEGIGGPLHLHTSITDLELGELAGDLTLDSDDLRVNEARGQLRVTTHAKDVDLSQIYGDVYVNNNHGQISIEPAGAFNIQAVNGKGDIEVTLPPNASAAVDVHTRNGDIVSDYPIPTPGDGESKSAKWTVGSGKTTVTLNTDVGDVHVKQGAGFPAEAPSSPAPPASPSAPHLKAPKTPPSAPVTQ